MPAMETLEERLADANEDPDSLLESASRYKDDPSWDFVMESIRRHRAEMDAEWDEPEPDAPPRQGKPMPDEKNPHRSPWNPLTPATNAAGP